MNKFIPKEPERPELPEIEAYSGYEVAELAEVVHKLTDCIKYLYDKECK